MIKFMFSVIILAYIGIGSQGHTPKMIKADKIRLIKLGNKEPHWAKFSLNFFQWALTLFRFATTGHLSAGARSIQLLLFHLENLLQNVQQRCPHFHKGIFFYYVSFLLTNATSLAQDHLGLAQYLFHGILSYNQDGTIQALPQYPAHPKLLGIFYKNSLSVAPWIKDSVRMTRFMLCKYSKVIN